MVADQSSSYQPVEVTLLVPQLMSLMGKLLLICAKIFRLFVRFQTTSLYRWSVIIVNLYIGPRVLLYNVHFKFGVIVFK